MITKNKGEWTELYVFFKLLSEGKLYSADKNQNPMPNSYLQILKVLREDVTGIKNDYLRNINTIDIYLNNTLTCSVPVRDFNNAADALFMDITQGQGRSFSIPATEAFMGTIFLKNVSDAGHKADIFLEVQDSHTGYTNETGFSIKSDYGCKASLINASEATNFVYKLEGTALNDTFMNNVNNISGSRKIIDRMNHIKNNNVELKFEDVYRDKTRLNLRRIDSNMPAVIGEALKISFLENKTMLSDVLNELTRLDPLDYQDNLAYSYKIKKLITACSLGLNLGKDWDGLEEATGGIIIVKPSGDIVAYHVYNRNVFEQFNIDNTKFERGSTTRHKFATIYKNGNDYYINLNLQLRYV